MEIIPMIRPTKLRRPKKPKGKTHIKIKSMTHFTPKPCPKGHTVCSCY